MLGFFIYTYNMPNFCKVLNTSWKLQPLEIFVKELRDICLQEFPALYPMVRFESVNTYKKLYFYGIGQDYIELSLQKTRHQGNIRSVTKFKINLYQQNWKGKVKLRFERDSRYFGAIAQKPVFLFECLLDELDNYFSALFLYKGLNKRSILLSPVGRYRKKWTDNEIILINNFCIVGMEPIRFLIPGKIKVPDRQTVFDFVIALLMKPYLFSEKVFDLPHFSFMFYNDRGDDAYHMWEQEVQWARD